MMKINTLRKTLILMSFLGAINFVSANNDVNDFTEVSVKLSQNSTPTAVDDTVTAVHYASGVFYNPTELLAVTTTINVLSNDSYGTDGPTSAHEPLTLVNGKQSTASANGGTITVSDNGTPNDKTDDVVTYLPPKGFSGTDSFTYSITDTTGDAATATVTITVASASPLAGPVNDTVSVAENSTNNVIDVMANDNLGVNGFGRMLIFSQLHLTAQTTQGGTINLIDNGTPGDRTDDSISYTPAANFTGTDTFYYYLEVDGVEYQTIGVDAGLVTITVGNVLPLASTPTAVNDVASVAYASINNVIDVLDNDIFGSDGAINGGLTMTNGTLNSASANGGLISVDNKGTLDTLDDEFRYSAPAGFSGIDTFSYTITDATGDASTATVTVTVSGLVVDTPTAVDDAISVAENSTQNIIDIIANDDFGTDGPYTYPINLTSFNGAGSSYRIQGTTTAGGFIELNDNGTPQDLSDDVYLYTPLANFTGIDTFTYHLIDANGSEAQAQVTITVGNVTPVVSTPTAVDDTASVNFGSTNNIILVLGNDTYGSDGPTLAHEPLSLVNGKQSTATLNGGLISVSDNGTPNDKTDDVVLYSAPSGFQVVDTFTYSITDASGDAATATVTITVTDVVTAVPTAVNDSASVLENSTNNSIQILVNDSFGIDGASSPPMSFSAGLFTQGFYIVNTTTNQGGSATIINDAVIHYTPAANFVGTDTFAYYIYDVNGDRDSALVAITVGAVVPPTNDTPTAVDDTASVAYASTNTIIDVLDNDNFGTDGAINGGLTMTNGTLNSASTNGGLISVDNKGTLDTLDDEFLYSAPNGFSGVDTFSYTITDASGDASTGTVTVTVASETNDPDAVDDYYTFDENSTDNELDIMANDNKGTNGASIFRADVGVTITEASPYVTADGTLSLLDNGTPNDGSDDKLAFTPANGFTGLFEFHYLYSVGEVNGSYTPVDYGYVYITIGTQVPPSGVLTAVDDNASVERYSISNYIDVLSNDSFGTNGPSITHPLTLSNGRATGTSAGGRFIQLHDNGTPNDLTDDRVSYSPGSLVSDSFTYTITDANGFATTGTVYITTTASSAKTSIEVGANKIFENEYLIYPNPSVNGNLKGTVLSSVNTKASIYLIDINGKSIYNTTIEFKEGRNDLNLNLNVKPGIMFLKIVSPEINFGTSKVIFK